MINAHLIEAGAANLSFVLRTQSGHYVMTVFDEKPWNEVVRLGQLMLLKEQHELPTSRLVSPKSGAQAVNHKGMPVIMKSHISGRVTVNLNRIMLHQIGAAMARLHQLPPPDFLAEKHAYGPHLFEAITGQNIDPKYEAWPAERISDLEYPIPARLPRELIHGDMFYDNVLFAGTQLQTIIDFEEACFTEMLFDLGMGIIGLCAAGNTISVGKARELVNGYQTVRVLNAKEQGALQLVAEYTAEATSGWWFWKYHLRRIIPAKAELHWQMAHLAEEIRTIPVKRFLGGVFA